MVHRVYDAMKRAYRDWNTHLKPMDPFLPRDPDRYSLSDDTRVLLLDALNIIGCRLPVDDTGLRRAWTLLCTEREAMLRRVRIGRTVDTEKLHSLSQAVKELEQFRFGTLDFDRLNGMLTDGDASQGHPR